MLLQLVTVLIFLKVSHEQKEKSHLISVITNFIKSLDSPTKISVKVCWNKENSNQLLKILTSRYHVNVSKMNLFYGLPEHQLFILDLNCKDSNKTLKMAENLKLFKHPFKWIFYGDTENLTNFHFGVDSQIYTIQKTPHFFEIRTLYKLSKNSTHFNTNSLAAWSPKLNKFVSYSKFTPLKRTNLMGTTIKISYVITNLDSLNHLWDYRYRNVDAISKVNYILVHHLIDFLNASKEFKMQRTWGYKNITTGLYSGMAGDLQQGLADLGGTPLFFTIDRIDIIDYIAATTPTYMKFIFKAPPLSYVTNVFTLPFDTTVWHCSFVMIVLIAICIYVIAVWEWKDPIFRKKIEKNIDTLKPKFFDVIMLDIGAISQQGSDVEPKSNSGRIATIFTFIALMFLYTSYSANVVALLQSTTDSIKTLEDLLNSRIKLGVEDIVYAHYYFETAQEPTRKKIYQQKVAPKGQPPNFMSAEEGIKKVQEGFFAFRVELSTGYTIIGNLFQENEKCSLKEIEYVNLIEPWLSTRKNSDYKEVMRIGMRKLHESGIQKRELRQIYTRKPVCHGKGSNFDSVGLIDCYAPFLVFVVGIGLSLQLLLLETFIKKDITRKYLKRARKIKLYITKVFMDFIHSSL